MERLHLESIESELILSYGSRTEGSLVLSINVDGTVSNTSTIKILSSARIILERSARPQVAGTPVSARIKILDGENNLITGFSSVASITLPQ